MKKIGLVGGISWTSTLDYYRLLNEEVNKRLGGLHYAECIIYSVDFYKFSTSNAEHKWDDTFELLAEAAVNLEKAGANMILLGANTAHIVAERVQASIGVPLIDIRVVTADSIQSRGIKKVGLIGTVYTMEMDFYKKHLIARSIEPIIPEKKDRDYIEDTLVHELGKGIIRKETKDAYLELIAKLINQGAEAILLGCTEIPLLIGQEDIPVPVFNTTLLHVQAAVESATN